MTIQHPETPNEQTTSSYIWKWKPKVALNPERSPIHLVKANPQNAYQFTLQELICAKRTEFLNMATPSNESVKVLNGELNPMMGSAKLIKTATSIRLKISGIPNIKSVLQFSSMPVALLLLGIPLSQIPISLVTELQQQTNSTEQWNQLFMALKEFEEEYPMLPAELATEALYYTSLSENHHINEVQRKRAQLFKCKQEQPKITSESLTLTERTAYLIAYSAKISFQTNAGVPAPQTPKEARSKRISQTLAERTQRLQNRLLTEHLQDLKTLTKQERETVILEWLEAIKIRNKTAPEEQTTDITSLKKVAVRQFPNLQSLLKIQDQSNSNRPSNTPPKKHTAPNLKSLPELVVQGAKQIINAKYTNIHPATSFQTEEAECKNQEGKKMILTYISIIPSPDKLLKWVTVVWKNQNKTERINFNSEAECLLTLGVPFYEIPTRLLEFSTKEEWETILTQGIQQHEPSNPNQQNIITNAKKLIQVFMAVKESAIQLSQMRAVLKTRRIQKTISPEEMAAMMVDCKTSMQQKKSPNTHPQNRAHFYAKDGTPTIYYQPIESSTEGIWNGTFEKLLQELQTTNPHLLPSALNTYKEIMSGQLT